MYINHPAFHPYFLPGIDPIARLTNIFDVASYVKFDNDGSYPDISISILAYYVHINKSEFVINIKTRYIY